MIYLLVAILQLAQSVFKVFDIKWSYENQTTKLMILNFLMSGAWILSTGIGVGAVMNGDLIMVSVYITFGGLGKWLAITVFHQNKYRNNLYKKLKNKDPST